MTEIVQKYSNSVAAMNHLVADAHVLWVKTHQAHWLMRSDKRSMNTFIPIHDYYDTYLDWLVSFIDDVAERVVQLNAVPISTMKDMFNEASITEETIDYSDYTMDQFIKRTVDDFDLFYKEIRASINILDVENDVGDSNKLQDYLSDVHKFIWFLNATLGEDVED